MATTYAQAQSLLKEVAIQLRSYSESRSEMVPISSAIGRTTTKEYVSPVTTPTFDSSAMDGFAVVAATTQNASVDNPVTFRNTAAIVAGDPVLMTDNLPDEGGFPPCIEIMTGARFPEVSNHRDAFDAVIRVEDVVIKSVPSLFGHVRYIQITKPVKRHAHKRFAGSDFQKGESVVQSQTIVRPHHILALASLGIETLEVVCPLKIGVWSTGKELLTHPIPPDQSSGISDANGPFLKASLQDLGAEVDFLGTIDDQESTFIKAMNTVHRLKRYDMIITTGAVSKGRLDFVPAAIKRMAGKIWFHGLSIRPGHPVLFATLPPVLPDLQRDSEGGGLAGYSIRDPIPFFGLPGNPIAVAACVRFLTVPFLNHVLGRPDVLPIRARLTPTRLDKDMSVNCRVQKHGDMDLFWHGNLTTDASHGWIVEPSLDQSPAKTKPFSEANCWVHLPNSLSRSSDEEIVDCYPF